MKKELERVEISPFSEFGWYRCTLCNEYGPYSQLKKHPCLKVPKPSKDEKIDRLLQIEWKNLKRAIVTGNRSYCLRDEKEKQI